MCLNTFSASCELLYDIITKDSLPWQAHGSWPVVLNQFIISPVHQTVSNGLFVCFGNFLLLAMLQTWYFVQHDLFDREQLWCANITTTSPRKGLICGVCREKQLDWKNLWVQLNIVKIWELIMFLRVLKELIPDLVSTWCSTNKLQKVACLQDVAILCKFLLPTDLDFRLILWFRILCILSMCNPDSLSVDLLVACC